jgi:hypothetical protein
MTPEHKAAMRAGRRAKGLTGAPTNAIALNEFAEQTVRRASLYLPSAKNAFLKAFSGKGKAAAIKAKCIECCNFERHQVTACGVRGCPLWLYRPFRGKGDDATA